jgi:hypothetical protein
MRTITVPPPVKIKVQDENSYSKEIDVTFFDFLRALIPPSWGKGLVNRRKGAAFMQMLFDLNHSNEPIESIQLDESVWGELVKSDEGMEWGIPAGIEILNFSEALRYGKVRYLKEKPSGGQKETCDPGAATGIARPDDLERRIVSETGSGHRQEETRAIADETVYRAGLTRRGGRV